MWELEGLDESEREEIEENGCFNVLLPCTRPPRALKSLSSVFRDECFPNDGIDPSLSLQWNAQLRISSGDCHSSKSSQGWSTHLWTTCSHTPVIHELDMPVSAPKRYA